MTDPWPPVPPPEGDDRPPSDSPPGPPQPYYGGPPPYSPQPYYGAPPGGPFLPPPQPPTPAWVGLLVGFIIGGLLGVAGPLVVVLILAGTELPGPAIFALVILLPLLLPLPLLFFRPTRSWGAGILAGCAITSIVLAGSCYWIISEFENAEASVVHQAPAPPDLPATVTGR